MQFEQALKAMADDTRRKIVMLLLKNNQCVRSLARKLEISESAVSQHMKILRQAGLVIGEKKGQFTHYDINRECLISLGEELINLARTEKEDMCTEKDNCHAKHKERCMHHKNEGGKGCCHGKRKKENE